RVGVPRSVNLSKVAVPNVQVRIGKIGVIQNIAKARTSLEPETLCENQLFREPGGKINDTRSGDRARPGIAKTSYRRQRPSASADVAAIARKPPEIGRASCRERV